jgi:hypothetical protein
MAVKYFCDKCGNEIEKGGIEIWVNLNTTPLNSIGRKFLCEECAEKFKKVKDRLDHVEDFFDMTDDDIALMEYDFKVGDLVITDTGVKGVIEDICDCDRCKARGFYEPKVKVTDGVDDVIWITDTDKSNGFTSFYQIGKYKFGNIDKESVEQSIEYTNNSIKESVKRLEEYEKQLRRLKRLEPCEEDEEEDSSEECSWLDWLL